MNSIPRLKDEYEIRGELGTGGMATVYKAVQKSLDRPVAIKELKKAYHGDEQIVQRFEREAKTSASFQHENIVHIYDYWKKPDYCIVMEFVDGTDLAEILEKTGPLPVDVGVMIALQACSALDYAHMRGLIHRDIKPSNIMVKRNGEVKLMDFGIAHTKKLQTLTQPGTFLGTPAYMSPEQILGQSLDVQSDIFSSASCSTRCSRPQALPGRRDPLRKRQDPEDGYISPRGLNDRIPRRLQWIIKKCLRKKPHRRYGSVQELARALGRRIAGTTKSASLKRVSDHLVENGVLQALSESETMVITKMRAMGPLQKSPYRRGGAACPRRGRLLLPEHRPAAGGPVPQRASAAAGPVPIAPQPPTATVEQKKEPSVSKSKRSGSPQEKKKRTDRTAN